VDMDVARLDGRGVRAKGMTPSPPVFRRYWSNLGSIYFFLQQYEEAIRCYERAVGE
jgi:tetratricopeptide (TPR) repeat protein